MKNQRRLFLRTETFERILIRTKSTGTSFRQDSKETSVAPQKSEKYRVEIYRIETDGEQRVFQCELFGSIEIIETDENI
jgi:hypothetical protein